MWSVRCAPSSVMALCLFSAALVSQPLTARGSIADIVTAEAAAYETADQDEAGRRIAVSAKRCLDRFARGPRSDAPPAKGLRRGYAIAAPRGRSVASARRAPASELTPSKHSSKVTVGSPPISGVLVVRTGPLLR